MSDRDIKIYEIVDFVRDDLRIETKYALSLCTDEEIESILSKADVVRCLEIEYIFTQMVFTERIKEEEIKTWDINDGVFYDLIKERYLPKLRKNKIDKLID